MHLRRRGAILQRRSLARRKRRQLGGGGRECGQRSELITRSVFVHACCPQAPEQLFFCKLASSVGIERVEQIEPCAWLRVDAHDTSIINHHRRERVVLCDVRNQITLAAEPGGGRARRTRSLRAAETIQENRRDARRAYKLFHLPCVSISQTNRPSSVGFITSLYRPLKQPPRIGTTGRMYCPGLRRAHLTLIALTTHPRRSVSRIHHLTTSRW